FSNPEFRAHLKSMKLPENLLAKVDGKIGMGAGIKQAARNMYDAVKGNIARLLGLPPKAESVLDLFAKAVDDFALSMTPQGRGVASKGVDSALVRNPDNGELLVDASRLRGVKNALGVVEFVKENSSD